MGVPPNTERGGPLGSLGPYLDLREFGPLRRSLREKPGWGKIPPRQWLMITTQRLNSLPRKSNQPFTRNEPWTWWTGPSLAPRRQRGAAANRRNFARAPLQGLMSRTRSGRSTMAQKGEQTRTSRLTQRRRPLGDCLHAIHWLRTAADHPHLLRAPSSGTDEEPRDVHQPVQGQSPGAEGPSPPRCRGADDGDLRRPGKGPLPGAEGPDRGPIPPTHPGTERPGGSRGEPLTWQPPTQGETFIILKADVTKAHRRIKVLQKDWKYQVACI